MAEVKISLLQSADDAERAVIADCTAQVLEKVFELPASSLFFRFVDLIKSAENIDAAIEIQLFPAGSARMRKMACREIQELVCERLQLPRERINVCITSPPQEKRVL